MEMELFDTLPDDLRTFVNQADIKLNLEHVVLIYNKKNHDIEATINFFAEMYMMVGYYTSKAELAKNSDLNKMRTLFRI